MTPEQGWPPIVDRATWDDARSVLLQQEKALTRMKDAISAARRRMPMVEVRSDYEFIGPEGPVTLLDLFSGRPQLIVLGWDLPWYSTVGNSFNEDFGATVDGEEHQAVSVFLRRDERVFHTWSTHARGEEPFMVVFDLLDLTPMGRQEEWENSPPGTPQEPTYSWMRLSDGYPAPKRCRPAV